MHPAEAQVPIPTNGADPAQVPGERLRFMPYSMILGQPMLKLALELAYVAPGIGGVLFTGERGTGKSTVVRAFSNVVHDDFPVTLPINATEDRVVGGWDIGELLKAKQTRMPGLLEQAHKKLLYIDEVNLLEDHLVNIILDATASRLLAVQREGIDELIPVEFVLVGTMNPSEGLLRPQLLDRFGLSVEVTDESDESTRTAILQAILDYDAALALERAGEDGPALLRVRAEQSKNVQRRKELDHAKKSLYQVEFSEEMARLCARIARDLQVEGYRGDYVLALAARAHAALQGAPASTPEDIRIVAPLAFQHRRPGRPSGGTRSWTDEDAARVAELTSSQALQGITLSRV